MTPDEVRRLADLESREVLLAKVAGGMQGILQQAISLISAPLSQAARLIAALEQAAAENPSLLAASGCSAGADQRRPGRGRRLRPSRPTPSWRPPEETTSEPSNEELAASAATAAPAAPPSAETAAEASDVSIRCGRQLGKNAHHGEAQHRRAP